MRFFDLHSDTPYECFKRGASVCDGSLAAAFGGINGITERKQCYAVWIDDNAPKPFELYKKIVDNFKSELALNKPKGLTAYLTVEGGAVLENDAERLYTLKQDGICALTLTWNSKNSIASGAYESGGLTDFGRRVIDRMNELKIACDLSHINRQGFFEALPRAKYPFASHSCIADICDHPRNLNCEQLRELFGAGGILGLCFYPEFLGGSDVFERLYRQIYTLFDMGYQKNIAFGSDFDGAVMSPQLESVQKIPEFYSFLLEKGIKNDALDDIFYNNANNFFLKL